MAVFYSGTMDGVTWRAVVENDRVTIQAGSVSKTYNRQSATDESSVRSLVASALLDSTEGPYRAKA